MNPHINSDRKAERRRGMEGKGEEGRVANIKRGNILEKREKRMERLEGVGGGVIWSENQNGWVEEKLSG